MNGWSYLETEMTDWKLSRSKLQNHDLPKELTILRSELGRLDSLATSIERSVKMVANEVADAKKELEAIVTAIDNLNKDNPDYASIINLCKDIASSKNL